MKGIFDPRRFIIIIPARFNSVRFPGKPLAKVGGEEMVVRVCRIATETGVRVVVATDDERIKSCVESNGYEAVMTSVDHRSGTDRIHEAFCKLSTDAEYVIGLQGDEPFITSSQLLQLMEGFISDDDNEIVTLVKLFNKENGFEALFDPNLVKVTRKNNGDALYFSRSIIPYIRGVEWKKWLDEYLFHVHIGVYGFTSKVLGEVTSLPRSPLEIAERLEQLRWLENGYSIKTILTDGESFGIDTPEDLAKAEEKLLLS